MAPVSLGLSLDPNPAMLRWLNQRKQRRVALLQLRLELVWNDAVFRMALLAGNRRAHLRRGWYDALNPALVDKQLREVSQALNEFYLRVEFVQGDLAVGVAWTPEAEKRCRKLSVRAAGAIRIIDEHLRRLFRELPPDRWDGKGGDCREAAALFEELDAEARDAARDGWRRICANWPGAVRLDRASATDVIQLAADPLLGAKFWTRVSANHPDGLLLRLVEGVWEARVRDDLRLLVTFDPMPLSLLSCLALDEWDVVRWTSRAAVEQAQARRASLHERWVRARRALGQR